MKSKTFKIQAPACIKEAWFDCHGSLIIKANDGDMVLITEEHLPRLRKLMK